MRIPSTLLVERSEEDGENGGIEFDDTIEEKPDGEQAEIDIEAI